MYNLELYLNFCPNAGPKSPSRQNKTGKLVTDYSKPNPYHSQSQPIAQKVGADRSHEGNAESGNHSRKPYISCAP